MRDRCGPNEDPRISLDPDYAHYQPINIWVAQMGEKMEQPVA